MPDSNLKTQSRGLQAQRATSYVLAAAIGLLGFFFSAPFPATLRLVIAFSAAALALLIRVWTVTLEGNPAETRERARIEDPGKNVALAIVLSASVFGLTAAIQLLGRTKDIAPHVPPAVTIGLGIFAVLTSWTLIHTAMQIRYAHMYYYECGDEKGLEFPGSGEPSDIDFAYFSFVIGMTFQVSDVQVMTMDFRRIVLAHGVLSFLFNTAIVALAINLISGLLH